MSMGSIPARAGEPSSWRGCVLRERGLSPRVRGNPVRELQQRFDGGSIPARAGEPSGSPARVNSDRVYPRACGGTERGVGVIIVDPGLSPRVRGNRRADRMRPGRRGSIPARAGEPPPASARSAPGWVYPRACGGTNEAAADPDGGMGLSPRVRGNHNSESDRVRSCGSIPARAGEPKTNLHRTQLPRVYPRACGGTAVRNPQPEAELGLSPRVRGNRRQPGIEGADLGSIPARAGEPSATTGRRNIRGVYPRACGGTFQRACPAPAGEGLSPRVRGNPFWGKARRQPCGSIPARAGEPHRHQPRRSIAWVYPRACGGTAIIMTWCATIWGLSPRVRGNPYQKPPAVFRCGSIPARAGEPR